MTYRNVRHGRGCGITLSFSLSFALLACSETNDPSPSSSAAQSFSGKLSKVIVEGHGPNSGAHYFLNVKDTNQVLELTFDKPPALHTGADLTVEGFPSDTRIQVTNYALVKLNLDPVGRAELPLTNSPIQKTRTVGVVAVDANHAGMHGVTNDQLQQLILDPDNPGPLLGIGRTDKSAREYYAENSYGEYKLHGAVEGPIPFDGSACVSGAENAAVSLRGDLTASYDSYVWYFGSVDMNCGYAWGEEGTWSNPAQNSWFNGRFDGDVFSHEFGHNVGLMHASTIACGDEPLADDPLTCTSDEYGNHYSVMGTGGGRHLNGIEKWYLTWFGGCNGVHVRQSGTFTLLPIELPCNGIQVLQIPMPNPNRTFSTEQSEEPTPLKYYYLELRTSQKLDTGMTPSVLVHASDEIHPPTEACARTALLDMDPTTGIFDGLRAGQSYTDPTGNLTFRVDSLDDNKAMVSVTMATNHDATTCTDGAVLVGPGPDTCDESFLPTGTGGAYGNYSGGDGLSNRDQTTNLGGANGSNQASASAHSVGGQPTTVNAAASFNAPANCGCRIFGPRSKDTSTFGDAMLVGILLLARQRRRQRANPIDG
jgi:hypothetical protein